jgi:hypothetical protein
MNVFGIEFKNQVGRMSKTKKPKAQTKSREPAPVKRPRGRPPGTAKFTHQEHLYLDAETKQRLDDLTEETGKNKSQLIRDAIMGQR